MNRDSPPRLSGMVYRELQAQFDSIEFAAAVQTDVHRVTAWRGLEMHGWSRRPNDCNRGDRAMGTSQ